MKKSLNEKMSASSLSELMPGFDKDAEWNRLQVKINAQRKKRFPVWKLAAAVLVLITAGAITTLLIADNNDNAPRIATTNEVHINYAEGILPEIPTALESPVAAHGELAALKPMARPTLSIGSTMATGYEQPVIKEHRSGEFICNSTPCSIEICIVQSIKCKDGNPSAIATCSTLEPDQARQLRFNTATAAGKNCKVTIEEIRIKRVTTGETIVLNAHSKPSTAEELFECLTGEMECNMLAGFFNADCNNQQKPHGLKIDKSAGDLILQ